MTPFGSWVAWPGWQSGQVFAPEPGGFLQRWERGASNAQTNALAIEVCNPGI